MELPLERETEGFEKNYTQGGIRKAPFGKKVFLSPTRGTEGVVKTIDKEVFEKILFPSRDSPPWKGFSSPVSNISML